MAFASRRAMRSSRAKLVCLGAFTVAVLEVHAGVVRAQTPVGPGGGTAPAAPGTCSPTEIEGATRTRRPPPAGAPSENSGEVPQRVDRELPRARRPAAYDPHAPQVPPVRPPAKGQPSAPARAPAPVL